MKKAIIALIVIIVVGVGIAVVVMNHDTTSSSTPPTETATSTATTTPTTAATFTLAQVATHKDGTSCYTVINGSVYDLTNWITAHPGGPDKILSICGIDGSAAFNAQHGGQQRQADILATFKIGTLVKP